MPAIMVGWTERVLTENFSFSAATGKILDFGLLNVSVSVYIQLKTSKKFLFLTHSFQKVNTKYQ